MASKHTMDLTTGSVTKLLLVFALPVMLSGLLQQLYNAADVIVVGKFAQDGDTALAAVGSTSSITVLLLNLFIGLSIGADIVCSNLVGARNREALSRAMHTSISLAAVCGVVIGIIGVVLARPLLKLMNCQESVIEQATVYMQIYFCGAPFSLLYNFGSGILRSFGDTRRPMYILAATGVANVALNLLFVIVFHMDVAGVALATICAQFLSAVVVLFLLFDPRGEYKMRLKNLRFHSQELRKTVTLGLPCGINSIVFSISNVLVQSTINTFSPAIVAANTTGSNVGDFVYLIISSLSTACVTFSGQCYGARQYKRIDRLRISAIALATGGTLLLAFLLTLFGDPVLGLYSNNPTVIGAAKVKLMILCWTYFTLGISDLQLCCMRGMGQSTVPTIVNICSICIPRIGWTLFIFPLLPEPWFLYLCYPFSWICSATAQTVLYNHHRKKIREREETEYAASH